MTFSQSIILILWHDLTIQIKVILFKRGGVNRCEFRTFLLSNDLLEGFEYHKSKGETKVPHDE
jgi:hypothetical protein